MKVVAINCLREAQKKYPGARDLLQGWYQLLSRGEFRNEGALKSTFGDMRGFNYEYKFPVPETTLLIYTLINFETQVAFIDAIKPGNH